MMALAVAAIFAMSTTTIVVASLSFVRWTMERDDRLDAQERAELEENPPLTDEVWTLKHDALLKQRAQHMDRWMALSKAGRPMEAEEQREFMAKVDLQLLKIGVRVVGTLSMSTGEGVKRP